MANNKNKYLPYQTEHVECTHMNHFYTAVFLPGLKGGKVLIWEKGTFVRGLSF